MMARGLIDELSAAKGSVVNVTSIAGSRVHPFAGAAYATSKAALASLTREMASDFGRVGVRVNSIAPGEIDNRDPVAGHRKDRRAADSDAPARHAGRGGEDHLCLCTETSSYVNGAEIISTAVSTFRACSVPMKSERGSIFLFDAFSSCEPVSTSLENALTGPHDGTLCHHGCAVRGIAAALSARLLSRGRAAARARQAARADRPRHRGPDCWRSALPLMSAASSASIRTGDARRREEGGGACCANLHLDRRQGPKTCRTISAASMFVTIEGAPLDGSRSDAGTPRAPGGASRRDPRQRILFRHGRPQPMARRLQQRAARLVEGKPVVGIEQRRANHRDVAGFFQGTRFHATDVTRVDTGHEISVSDLRAGCSRSRHLRRRAWRQGRTDAARC